MRVGVVGIGPGPNVGLASDRSVAWSVVELNEFARFGRISAGRLPVLLRSRGGRAKGLCGPRLLAAKALPELGSPGERERASSRCVDCPDGDGAAEEDDAALPGARKVVFRARAARAGMRAALSCACMLGLTGPSLRGEPPHVSRLLPKLGARSSGASERRPLGGETVRGRGTKA